MQSGDREEMRQSGIAKRLLRLLGHRAALARNDGRGDATRRAGQRRGDAARHLVPQLHEPLAPAAALACVTWRDDAARAAIAVPDAADPGEIELALHVAPARQYLARHREEHRLDL